MKTKICSKCKKEKLIQHFCKHKISKDGLNNQCKECAKLYNKVNKKTIQVQKKEYYKINRNKLLKRAKKYHSNPVIFKKLKIYHINYYLKNRNKILRYTKNYYNKRKKLIIKKIVKYNNKRYKNDINFKIRQCLKSRLNQSIKRIYKSNSIIFLLGCSIDFLKQHLESQFKLGMSWENWGTGHNGKGMQEWHIDHIRPCASFDLSKPEEQRKCFHYINLQPLWAEENLAKRQRDRDIYEK
jgi:hypothetical protein